MKKVLSILLICVFIQNSVIASEHKIKEKFINGMTAIKDGIVFVLEIPLMIIAFPFAFAMFANDNPNK
jgi:hypothetical protein